MIAPMFGTVSMSNPERVRALTVMSTWAWPTPPAEFHTRIFPWRTMHAPLVGPYLLGRHNVLAGCGMYLSVVGSEKFRHEVQAAYEAVLPDAETRLLTWVWPRWIPLDDMRNRPPRVHNPLGSAEPGTTIRSGSSILSCPSVPAANV
jgi:hypothetical protein